MQTTQRCRQIVDFRASIQHLAAQRRLLFCYLASLLTPDTTSSIFRHRAVYGGVQGGKAQRGREKDVTKLSQNTRSDQAERQRRVRQTYSFDVDHRGASSYQPAEATVNLKKKKKIKKKEKVTRLCCETALRTDPPPPFSFPGVSRPVSPPPSHTSDPESCGGTRCVEANKQASK